MCACVVCVGVYGTYEDSSAGFLSGSLKPPTSVRDQSKHKSSRALIPTHGLTCMFYGFLDITQLLTLQNFLFFVVFLKGRVGLFFSSTEIKTWILINTADLFFCFCCGEKKGT